MKTLASLAQVPAVAAAFADTNTYWYHIWLYSFANSDYFLKRDWSKENSDAEYREVKAWAVHMFEAYNGTGKTFMAGNWEGDWMLMAASGCKENGELIMPGDILSVCAGAGKFNMTCDPTPAVIDRMIRWVQIRQQAIADARKESQATDVQILYYIEMNLGPQALAGKPGVANSVVPVVQPDLVSYSSYASTNAYATTKDIAATDHYFHAVLDYVQVPTPVARH